MCDHKWISRFHDASGNGGMDDFDETMKGWHDAGMSVVCEKCNHLDWENHNLKAQGKLMYLGNVKISGKFTIEEFSDKLMAMSREDLNSLPKWR